MNETDLEWKNKLDECSKSKLVTHPRGIEVSEIIAGQYKVPMPAYLTLESRKVNYPFMFAEAWWILSGSNRVEDIDPYMKFYKTFSDDGIFMRGAYGPKVVDQLGFVIDTLEKDNDSRQAVINIWRERPGTSKDIPCTLSLQFLIRNKRLNVVTTMRSNDIVKGFTYDVFTFSMIGLAIKLLLSARGVEINLGELFVNAGSLHLYESDKTNVEKWLKDFTLSKSVDVVEDIVSGLLESKTYNELLLNLERAANVKY